MILLTGGSGVLGTELQKLIKCHAPHRVFDITRHIDFTDRPSLFVHCAAFTDLVRAEKERDLCYQTNVIGTRNIASHGIPMLYISTEYVFDGEKGNYSEEDYPNPKNFYAFTKLLGEYESRRTRSVVLRCLFKARPFKHVSACVDQYTTGDYVDRIAPEIALAIREFDQLPPTIHIGFERKSTFELAEETRSVKRITVDDVKEVRLPRDTSLNTSKWKELKCRLSLQEQITDKKK